jgi:hypothetical protein
MLFSRVVASTAIASQLGIFSFVPNQYQKPVSAGVLGIGILAILAGNEKQGSAIVQARLAKRDIFTEPGKPGASKENALYQVFLTAGELALAKAAVIQQSQPALDRPMHEKMLNLAMQQWKPKIVEPVDPADFDRVNIPKTELLQPERYLA